MSLRSKQQIAETNIVLSFGISTSERTMFFSSLFLRYSSLFLRYMSELCPNCVRIVSEETSDFLRTYFGLISDFNRTPSEEITKK